MPLATGTGEVSRWYVSNARETEQGTLQTLDRSFFAISNTVRQKEVHSKRKGVTGQQNAIARVREKLMSGGSITDNLYPAIVNWVMRHLFGGAPTTTAVGASATAKQHVWDTITLPPSTFSMVKQHALVANAVERMTGLGITEVVFKSVEGVMSIEVKVEGLGSGYTISASEPVVSPLLDAAQDPMVGVRSTLLIDDVELAVGVLGANWQVTIFPGFGLLPTAGSLDKSVTRFDKVAQRNVVAVFDRYAIDATMFNDFIDETHHELTFRARGETIAADGPGNVEAMIEITIAKARAVNDIPADIGDLSVFKMPQVYEGIIDLTLSPVRDVTIKTQDLTAAP